MRSLLISAFLLLALSVAAQEALQIDTPEPNKPYTHLNFKNNPEQFQFAIVTDRTGGHRPGVFETAVDKLNLLQPEFVMSVGDLIEGYTEDLEVLNQEWKEFDGFVNALEMPFFYVPGNHDITNQVMEDLWKERFGPTHYHFIYKDVLFLCLNSEDQKRGSSRGTISDEQYEYIEKTLAEHTEVKWTLVFMHQPLWLQDAETLRWNDVEKLLADRQHTVFVGHRHNYIKFERNNGRYYMLATTGGGSSLRGPKMGEFDHVVWVTMTEAGPLVANLLLEGIWDDNVMTEDNRALIDGMLENNVFQFDPLYLEEGEFQAGAMKIRIRNDENVPMKLRFLEGFSWDLVGNVVDREAEVAPNSSEIFVVSMQSRNEKPLADKEPFVLKIEVSYEMGVEKAITIPFRFNLKPFQKQFITKTKIPKVIDGQMNDWKNDQLSFTKIPGAPEDLTLSYGMQYDSDYLYFGAKVIDDELNIDTSLAIYQQDGIGLAVNGALFRESVQSKGAGWYRDEAMVRMSPASNDLPSTEYFSKGLPEGTLYKCVQTEEGYNVEVAIPLTYLTDQQGNNWKTARINIIVEDYDADFEARNRYFIYPDWRYGDNIPGSGMFFKD
jgi:hypothetical protein